MRGSVGLSSSAKSSCWVYSLGFSSSASAVSRVAKGRCVSSQGSSITSERANGVVDVHKAFRWKTAEGIVQMVVLMRPDARQSPAGATDALGSRNHTCCVAVGCRHVSTKHIRFNSVTARPSTHGGSSQTHACLYSPFRRTPVEEPMI